MSESQGNKLAERAYYSVLVGLIYGAPVWLALRSGIADSDFMLRILHTVPLSNIIYLLGLLVAFIGFGLGSTLSPIGGEPFRLYLIGSAPGDRRVGFGLRLLRTGLWTIGISTGFAVLLWSLVPPALQTSSGLLMSLLAAVGVGSLILAAWLAGSIVSPLVARLGATIAIVVAASTYILVPTRIADIQSYISGTALISNWNTSIAIAFMTVITSSALILAALNRVSGERVIEQAQRWRNMIGLAGIGDFAGAQSHLRSSSTIARNSSIPPSFGRYRTGVWLGSQTLRRAPWRIIWIFGLELPAIILIGNAIGGSNIFLAAIAGIAQYLAFALFGERLSFAVSLVRPPSLVGGTRLQNLGAQLTVPLVFHLVAITICIIVARYFLAMNITAIALWSVILIPVHLFTLVYYANKQQPPLWVHTPIYSPFGDLSSIAMLFWQFDFILIIAALSTVVFLVFGICR